MRGIWNPRFSRPRANTRRLLLSPNWQEQNCVPVASVNSFRDLLPCAISIDYKSGQTVLNSAGINNPQTHSPPRCLRHSSCRIFRAPWNHFTESSEDGSSWGGTACRRRPSRRNAATGVAAPGSPDSDSTIPGTGPTGRPPLPAPPLFIIYITRDVVCAKWDRAGKRGFAHAGRVCTSGRRPRQICHVADAVVFDTGNKMDA